MYTQLRRWFYSRLILNKAWLDKGLWFSGESVLVCHQQERICALWKVLELAVEDTVRQASLENLREAWLWGVGLAKFREP